MCLFSMYAKTCVQHSALQQDKERALTTHCQSQHNFMEVLIPYNSLLNGSEGIFGPEGEMR